MYTVDRLLISISSYSKSNQFINNVVKSGKKWFINFIFEIKIASSLINLIGTYECKLDAKGRFMLPAALKKQLAAIVQDGFVLKRSVFQPCLELYPMCEWDVMMQRINKLNRFNKKNNDFIRRFTAGVKIIEVDTSGRLLIPKDLIQVVKLTKNLTLSSAINIIEIWDKQHYEQAIDEAAIDFADLAEQVMGDDTDQLS